MSNAIQSYQFQSHQIRIISNEDGEPWFIAKDVCNILGYTNSRKVIADHCRKAGVTNSYIPTLSNNYTLIDEGNLYRLIIKSNKPESEPFESWVCDEVLPAIRKTGSYSVNPNNSINPAHLVALQAELLKANPRLQDVLNLAGLGYSHARIGEMLGLGNNTVYRSIKRLRDCGFVVRPDGALKLTHGGVQ